MDLGEERHLSLLADELAGLGYRVIALGHRESGPAQLRVALKASNKCEAIRIGASDLNSYQKRFLDIDAAWKAATQKCRPAFRLLASHSMGAQTTMMEAGARSVIGPIGKDRFDAYIALSPQRIGYRYQRGAWRSVSKPVLLITGTRDNGVDGDYNTRLTAFYGLPPGGKRLAIIKGASHRNLAGKGSPRIARLAPMLVKEFLINLQNQTLDQPKPIKGVTIRAK